MVSMHATDLPFFDARLNMLGWVLLAGLCGFIRPLLRRFQRLIVMLPQPFRWQRTPEVLQGRVRDRSHDSWITSAHGGGRGRSGPGIGSSSPLTAAR